MRGAPGFVSHDARLPTVLAALLLAGLSVLPAAFAEQGSAVLLARGPLDLEGAVDLTGEQAGLVLRDPGTASWERVQLGLRALQARVDDVTIQESCLTPTHIGALQVSGFNGHTRLALASEVGDAARLVPGLLPVPVPAVPPAPPVPVDEAAASAAEAVGVAVHAAGEVSAALPAGSAPEASCMEMVPSSDDQSTRLRNLTLDVRPADAAYVIAYQGTEEDARGVVTLSALDGALDVLRGGDTVTPVADSETEFRESAPSFRYDSGLLRVDAASATGAILGHGELLVYRAAATVSGTTEDGRAFSKLYTPGETRTAGPVPGLAVQQRRTLEFLRVTFEDGEGSFRSPGQVAAYASSAAVDLDGTLGMPAAWGHVDVGNRTFVLDGAPARLSGVLGFHVAKAERHGASRHGPAPPEDAATMAINVDGDVSRVETAQVSETFPALAETAAAVSGFALLAGALAYFWPAIKFGGTALYTRIPRDAVLMHGARERIYRLVKDEPGIHAHEVAERLGLGWGTTVYHLKLLEKNQLLVARHEGRYKRFFVTGDARIQHKDAIALLRNGTAASIAAQVAKRPGLIQKDVCQALGMSPSLASWHLQRLVAAGVVKAERWGRTVRYAPGPAWEELNGAAAAAPVAEVAAVPVVPAAPQPQA